MSTPLRLLIWKLLDWKVEFRGVGYEKGRHESVVGAEGRDECRRSTRMTLVV